MNKKLTLPLDNSSSSEDSIKPGSKKLSQAVSSQTNHLMYHLPILEKIVPVLKEYGLTHIDSYKEEDFLSHQKINCFLFQSEKWGEVKIMIGLKDDFWGQSFRTEFTPTIHVKNELFGLSQDLDVQAHVDYTNLSVEDIEAWLQKTLTEALTLALWG